jgi:hypothetical protein
MSKTLLYPEQGRIVISGPFTESLGKSFETLARQRVSQRATIWPDAFSRTEPSEPSS